MKKILFAFSALLLVVVMTVSCNKNSPKDVAATWLNGFYHMDYEAAKKVSTDDTKALLSQLQQFTTMITDSAKKEMKKINVEIKSVKEDGDKAKVMYVLSESKDKEQPLDLVKKDGKWLVQFSKNDQVNGATDNSADQPAGDSTGTVPADTAATLEDTVKH